MFQFYQVFTERLEKSVDPDQLASQKPADLALHSFPYRINPSLAWCGLKCHLYNSLPTV